MPIRLRLSVLGEDVLDRTLLSIEAAEDMRPAFEAIADVFLESERRQFATEGRWGSGGWAPLSPDYARWKARHYPGQPILRRDDDLFRSLTSGPAVRRIERDRVWLGSDVDHGRYHQLGQGVPRRRPVELPESVRRRMVKIMQRFAVTGKVRG